MGTNTAVISEKDRKGWLGDGMGGLIGLGVSTSAILPVPMMSKGGQVFAATRPAAAMMQPLQHTGHWAEISHDPTGSPHLARRWPSAQRALGD